MAKGGVRRGACRFWVLFWHLYRFARYQGCRRGPAASRGKCQSRSLAIICAIMGWSVLRWSSAWRHAMESGNIKNLFLLECSMHSRASSMARASAVKVELWSWMQWLYSYVSWALLLPCVFRTVSVECYVSGESFSYGKILVCQISPTCRAQRYLVFFASTEDLQTHNSVPHICLRILMIISSMLTWSRTCDMA